MSHLAKILKEKYQVSEVILKALNKATADCQGFFTRVQENSELNQLKVLSAFQEKAVSDFHLHGSTGYGYGDSGRDTLEEVYATIFGAEKALVRSQIVSGTHAIALGLLGNLNRGDELISVTGKPYDTLLKVIGTKNEEGSLRHYGVLYNEIPLRDDWSIDVPAVLAAIKPQTKMLFFQRSRGYEWRPAFSVAALGQVFNEIKQKHPQIICFVDNCYGEFVEIEEPTQVGADLLAGSLIKNPGGGLALTGGYLLGKRTLVERGATRLAAPGIGLGVGASLNFNRPAFQGLFLAPSIVAEATKGAILAASFFRALGFSVNPQPEEARTDIIQAIQLGSKELMVAFCQGLQKACPLDSHVRPEPALLPGYYHEVIMAGGTFIQGSSIELSADGPLRPPYNIYLQGGLSLSHIKIGLALAASAISKIKGD